LKHSGDEDKVGFQYVDWLAGKGDISAVIPTAINGAHNYHDANYLALCGIRDYRDLRQ
jgi:hypothetical protein